MSNIYRQFIELLPKRPLQVATVVAVDGSAVTVQLPGGGLLQVRGDALPGDQVFVRDGVIEGAAPALPIETIAV